GNILEIRRSTSPLGNLTIFSFTPGQGGPLTAVTIRGQGFANTAASNVVAFNGKVAAVLSATRDTLVASAPVGATSGPISVTVGGNTTNSATSFQVASVPLVTSIKPGVVEVTQPASSLQVTGASLVGSKFEFLPLLQPLAITIGTPSVSADGSGVRLPI